MRYLFGFLCVCALGVVPLLGCSEDNPGCMNRYQCDDEDKCTEDVCVDGSCENPPMDCNPHSNCITAWWCEPEVGCMSTAVPDGTECYHPLGPAECRGGVCVFTLN